MLSIKAATVSEGVGAWMANPCPSRILHVFDRACNLVNERGAVLSLVSERIGNGPFNVVLGEDVCFRENLDRNAAVFHNGKLLLTLGQISVVFDRAELWSARVNWDALHEAKEQVFERLPRRGLPRVPQVPPYSFIPELSTAVVRVDIPSLSTMTTRLAGLGGGLTPAGDDILVGAMLAAWIIHSPETAKRLAHEIASLAVPLTTSLSGAWVRAAARGEAGITWHRFLNDLLEGGAAKIWRDTSRLLATGASSGADALAGFLGVFRASFEGVSSR